MDNPDLEVNRKTIDIDANWIQEYNEDRIMKIIGRAVRNVNTNYNVELYRKPGKNVSMGINVLDDDKITTKIDMDIKDNPFYIECTINDVRIKYSNFNKMMTDKLLSISGEHIFRRVKDLLDIYLIIETKYIEKKDIDKVLKYENKKLGDFSTLFNNIEMIEKSYNKLKNIDNKPNFAEVWTRIIKYLEQEKFIKKVIDNIRTYNSSFFF